LNWCAAGAGALLGGAGALLAGAGALLAGTGALLAGALLGVIAAVDRSAEDRLLTADRPADSVPREALLVLLLSADAGTAPDAGDEPSTGELEEGVPDGPVTGEVESAGVGSGELACVEDSVPDEAAVSSAGDDSTADPVLAKGSVAGAATGACVDAVLLSSCECAMLTPAVDAPMIADPATIAIRYPRLLVFMSSPSGAGARLSMTEFRGTRATSAPTVIRRHRSGGLVRRGHRRGIAARCGKVPDMVQTNEIDPSVSAAATPTAGATDEYIAALSSYLDASPTPFHACREAAKLLAAAGYVQVVETDRFPSEPGLHYLIRGGSLVAWNSTGGTGRFRIVGAHTDSPNLRIKPRPDSTSAGWQLLGVETYGGPLVNSWLDRDLGLAGRVAVRDAAGVRTELLHITDPILRVSQLAIHLDRQVNQDGLRLNPQQHLAPHWGIGTGPADFRGFVGERVGVDGDDVLSWDLMTVDLTAARRIGRHRDLIASGRLDNLATSFAAVRALIASDAGHAEPVAGTRLIVLFDHEEVGSTSASGAGSTLLPAVLERIVLAAGGDRQDHLCALAGSVIASGDMAHAIHPNYPERHEPEHPIAINGGPVLKINNNLNYATDAVGAAAFLLACEQAGVPMQQFVMRTDMACGSTVGPITAAATGARTVDFGAPMLSMHSAREVAGAQDQPMYAAALAAFLGPASALRLPS
jgi:aspartyl aminopeptidase